MGVSGRCRALQLNAIRPIATPSEHSLEELESPFAIEHVLVVEDFMADLVRRSEYPIDVLSLPDRRPAAVDRKYRISRARFYEQTARRDQTGEVIHLYVVQDPGHIVVDAMRQAEYAVAKCVEVA